LIYEEYFKKRLSDVYDLSVIKYMNGEGFIEYNDIKLQVEWELNISVEGRILLVLSIPGFFDRPNQNIKLYGKKDIQFGRLTVIILKLVIFNVIVSQIQDQE
jgi:hypothetical protein